MENSTINDDVQFIFGRPCRPQANVSKFSFGQPSSPFVFGKAEDYSVKELGQENRALPDGPLDVFEFGRPPKQDLFSPNEKRGTKRLVSLRGGSEMELPDGKEAKVTSFAFRKQNDIPTQPQPTSELKKYQRFLHNGLPHQTSFVGGSSREEMKTTPLFSWSVMEEVLKKETAMQQDKSASRSESHIEDSVFPQYGLLGHVADEDHDRSTIDPIFVNTNSPWSIFICGSQGSGKSHTLACVLENCLLINEKLGKLVKPLAALVLHFDGAQEQEKGAQTASLSSKVSTRILVSPSNFHAMQEKYKKSHPRAKVEPLFLSSRHLNTERIMRLMQVDLQTSQDAPLYIYVVLKLIRYMSDQSQGNNSFDWQRFKQLVDLEFLTDGQKAMLKMRMDLVESFMPGSWTQDKKGGQQREVDFSHNVEDDIFKGNPGELTLIDLSDPMLDASTACTLFEIAVTLFVAGNKGVAKVVALDEAHAYMHKDSPAAEALTKRLVVNVREQRHRAVRVIVATQEPTINTDLLDLCTVSIVHRFSSPLWYKTVRNHLAGAGLADMLQRNEGAYNKGSGGLELFSDIVRLKVGESLLFCPTAALKVEDGRIVRLDEYHVKFRTRQRVTEDGGKSKMANEG